MLFVPKKKAREIKRKLIEENEIRIKKIIDEDWEEYINSQNGA